MNEHALSRRRFLALTAAGVAVSAAPGVLQAAQRPPNVIYAFSDEHRWQSMSFTETPEVRTPNMARMAAEGVQFTHCVSNYPVCTPYRGIVMTGRWPYQTGLIDNGLELRRDEPTLGKTFRAAGYRTGYIGKWHLGGLRAEPFGFDESYIWSDDKSHWDSEYHPAEGGPVRVKGYNATGMTDQALGFMRAHRDEPFFLMLSWIPPHADFLTAPEAKKALYPEGSLPRRPNAPEATGGGDDAIWNQNGSAHYRGYHAHISAIDDELGRLVAELEAFGIADNTILVYTSDHGSMQGSHGVGSKRQPYEESIRVPFLVRAPGRVPAGRRDDALFGAIDVFPTLCGLAGVPVPASAQGQDFSGRLLGEGGPDPESQFIMHISKDHATGGQKHPAPLFRGVRTRTHTYAVFPEGGGLLFDNVSDPYQQHNLFDAPEARDARARCDALLRDWLRKAEEKRNDE